MTGLDDCMEVLPVPAGVSKHAQIVTLNSLQMRVSLALHNTFSCQMILSTWLACVVHGCER